MEFALSSQAENESKNLIRAKIREYFRERDCLCLVRPLNDEHRLARIEDEDWNSLRPEFM